MSVQIAPHPPIYVSASPIRKHITTSANVPYSNPVPTSIGLYKPASTISVTHNVSAGFNETNPTWWSYYFNYNADFQANVNKIVSYYS